MNARRNFLKMASAAGVPAAAAILTSSVVQADNGGVKDFLGSWDVWHSLPAPPGYFLEMMSFSEGGVFHETNTLLNNSFALDFAPFGVPYVLNGSDGYGNWRRRGKGTAEVVFKKFLFTTTGFHVGYLLVTGTVESDGKTMIGNWNIRIVDPAGNRLANLGAATTTATKIGA